MGAIASRGGVDRCAEEVVGRLCLTTFGCGRQATLENVVNELLLGRRWPERDVRRRCVWEKSGRGQCGGEMAVEGSVNMAKKRGGLVV